MTFQSAKNIIKSIFLYTRSYFDFGRYNPAAIPRLSIETTNLCYSRCIFCANTIMKRPRMHLEEKLFKKAVDEFVGMGGTNIDFNSCIGEPLLNPHLLELARYVRQFPQIKQLGFITTLQWLHKFNIDEFFSSGITWLGISLTLSGKEKYYEFFGIDMYDVVIKNLTALLQKNVKATNKIYVMFSIKPTDEPVSNIVNHPDFKAIQSLADKDLTPQLINRSQYYDDWLGKVKLPSYLKKHPLYPRIFHPCMLLYRTLTIFSNGDISPCGCRNFESTRDLVLGNISTTSLSEIWNGERLAELRRSWRIKNKIPVSCTSCRHYLY
jgi:radical SAM protein with 4Fe4S-binding SPASM domain